MQERQVIKQHITHTLISGAHLTRGGLADGGVVGAELEAVHAEAVEAAVGVDAALGTRVGGHALVDVHARLPVALQLESRMTPALKAARAKGGGRKKQNKKRHNLTAGRAISRYSLLRFSTFSRSRRETRVDLGFVCL